MQIFSILCENNYGSNIFMNIGAKDEAQAIRIFKKEAKIQSIEKEALAIAREMIREYKEYIKRKGYASYNFGFRTDCFMNPSDFSKEGFKKLLEIAKQNYINDYYNKDGAIQWNLDNNIFQIKNLSYIVDNLNKAKVLDMQEIYHGR